MTGTPPGGATWTARTFLVKELLRPGDPPRIAADLIDNIDLMVTGEDEDLTQDIGDLGAEQGADLRGGTALRAGLAGEHQVRLGQLPDLLQLQDEPVRVPVDVEPGRVRLRDPLHLIRQLPDVHLLWVQLVWRDF